MSLLIKIDLGRSFNIFFDFAVFMLITTSWLRPTLSHCALSFDDYSLPGSQQCKLTAVFKLMRYTTESEILKSKLVLLLTSDF
jgi:hypothetical protein